ncbi:S8 family serine peptidase [Roseovarius rhodophyticola]|uniref:S8 family serine peptidase n=1 Tax=Roseovarius rhodophyticola TaxID=3080827 RepID=A0ABZ2TGS2_9RHOB|nr:S8 family serine peptidase [Roseovarius sp. W115]MDV2929109.1 S8 family serine peptidase [Roseovarius sp. W115]
MKVTGREDYPQYDALWHLQTLGVLDKNNAPLDWSAEPPAKPTRVAVIDTSVAIAHPNLAGVINKELSLDFFSARLGSFPFLPKDQEKIGELDLKWDTEIAEGLPLTEKLLAELVDRLSKSSKPHSKGIQPCTSPAFSAHGTNVAGLVGARPCIAEQVLPTGEKAPLALPYSGVDPMCEIVQISNNFDPEPEGLIMAFLYADLIDADVVLLPRNIADPHRIVPELGDIKLGDQSLTDLIRQVGTQDHHTELWSELSALIVNVSQSRPVVCAAGNANEETGIYPANLASDHNGIVSVGAVNAKGFCSSYSVSRNITVMAPSNDAEIFDAAEVRLDEKNAYYDPTGVPDSNSNCKYSSFDVISTDVPGLSGYSGSVFLNETVDGALLDYGSYFSRFGGTSAASALVAGFLSLGRSTGAYEANSGLVAKSWLLGKCHVQKGDDEEFCMPCWSGTPIFPDA